MILNFIFQELNETRPYIDCLDLKWIIGTFLGTIIAGTGVYISWKKYKHDVGKDTKSNVGSTMVRYWSKREDANKDILEKLKKAKKEIFIAGIGLTTISKSLLEKDVLKHLAALIDNENSTFKIRIIGCDSIPNAKRTFINSDKVGERIESGKIFLNEFLGNLKNEVKGKNAENLSKFIELNNYPDNITPRHSIIKIDDYIYVGSYMLPTLGKESYTLKLIDEEPKEDKYSGLYNLFKSEIDILKENCTNKYKL